MLFLNVLMKRFLQLFPFKLPSPLIELTVLTRLNGPAVHQGPLK